MDDKAHIYQFDNVQVEREGFRVWKDDAPVQIEPKAFQVLVFLIENRGRLVEKRELLDAVWKETFAGFRNGIWNIWWVSLKDKTQKQLTNFNKLSAYVRYPAWSPLGNQIVFEYAEMTGNVWMMELK
jgi:DNA-binding response OmpR family regulator